jgi:hypothetical protein
MSYEYEEEDTCHIYLAHGTHSRPLVSVLVVHHDADLFMV